MTSIQNNTERFQNIKYDELENPGSSPRSKIGVFRSKVWPFTAGVTTTLVIVLLISLIRPSYTTQTKTSQEIEDEEWNHCGRSSADAVARGCVMEPNFYGWLPSQCVFPELSEKYPVFEDRTWFLDVNLTQAISTEELWEGKYAKIYARRIHGEHCLFQWRKLRYGMENEKEFLDSKTFSGHHAKHCADQLSVRCEGAEDKTEVELGFYHCKKTIW